MALGIPTSQESFLRAQQSDRADFARRFLGGWEQYHHLLGADLEEMAALLRGWGVVVVRDASLEDFAELFAGKFDVVILFSHWNTGAVEFADGLAPVPAVIERIPPAFSGMLDLCVCHPLELVRQLRQDRPALIVKHLSAEAAPHYWLKFYAILFHQLHSRELTYVEAIEEVAGAFLDWASASGGV
jgi:hypothetical protein